MRIEAPQAPREYGEREGICPSAEILKKNLDLDIAHSDVM